MNGDLFSLLCSVTAICIAGSATPENWINLSVALAFVIIAVALITKKAGE